MADAPLDPRVAAARLNERARGTNIAARGTRFLEVSAERAVAELPFRQDLSQLTGLFHGGVIVSLADETATACALAITMPDGVWDVAKFPMTIQLSANLIGNTDAGKLVAEAVPLHRGRTTLVIQTTVRDERGRTIAVVTATQLVLHRG
jgi:uncharacterized protein (TIGR00369 family)